MHRCPSVVNYVMALVDTVLLAASGISFLFFGTSCLFSQKMRKEFDRYGLAGFRKPVGALQLAGAIGQIAGFWIIWLGGLASLGLAVIMFAGVAVRIVIKDDWLEIVPALSLALLNGYLTGALMLSA